MGGAGIAASRLACGLVEADQKVRLWGINPSRYADFVHPLPEVKSLISSMHRRLRSLSIKQFEKNVSSEGTSGSYFFSDRSVHGGAVRKSFTNAGILHFHWICHMLDFFDTLPHLPAGVPVFWTMHDMSAFTGGCTYSLNCQNFKSICEACPQQRASEGQRIIKRSHARKERALASLNDRLTIISPSQWMASKVKESALMGDFRSEIIPNGYDLEVFHPRRRSQGRAKLGLGVDDRLVTFVAASVDNPLKGMDLLEKALPEVEKNVDNFHVAVIGDAGDHQWPKSWKWLGNICDEEELAEVYAAADLLITPSRADNFPNVIGEALSCGLPVIGSRVGGIPEMIEEGKTGYLFPVGSSDELTRAVLRYLQTVPLEREGWSRRCREFAYKRLSLEKMTSTHLKLYQEGLDSGKLTSQLS
jgi:glycosyltransferase involved in cell wall biosynthesis